MKKINILGYETTQFGVCKLFADIYRDVIRYNKSDKKFYIWDDSSGIWKVDNEDKIGSMIESFLSIEIFGLIENLNSKNTRQKYITYYKKMQNNAAVEGIIKGLKRNSLIIIEDDDFNKDSNYLNCMNKVFDSSKLIAIKHDKSLLISKQCNVVIDEKCSDRTWKDFVMDIVDQDEELYDYLLRMIYYAMCGNSVDECMFIFYGPTTRNGKSTFINAITYMMGSYAITAKPEDISKGTRSSSGPTPQLVRLKGKRLISIGEASHNQKLDVALIKAFTGNDPLVTRGLFEDFKEFVNKGVLMLHTNYLPIVDDMTLFTSNRVIVVPFDVKFSQDEIDPKMFEKLIAADALSGLMNEIRRVAKKYKGIGIKEWLPKRVIESTQRFANQSDIIGWFLKEMVVKKQGSYVFSTAIYMRYKEWGKDKDIPIMSHKAFTMALNKKGYKTFHRNNGNIFKGIKLKKKFDKNV